jgi:hypothetical protein
VFARRASALLLLLGSVLLFVGILAGYLNVQVLDGNRFAEHVDTIRRDPAVASQVGQAITDRVLQADPDLIALRPLIEAVATSLASSETFTPVVTATARQVHEFFTDRNPGQFTVRLADIGTIVGGVLSSVAPTAAHRIPRGLDVVLAEVGDQTVADTTIRWTRWVGLLAWVLPVLAFMSFAGAVALARDRFRTAARSGWCVAVVGGAVALVWWTGTVVASAQDTSSLRGALLAASWHAFGGPLIWVAAVTVVAGALLVAAASGAIPKLDPVPLGSRVWAALTRSPVTTRARLLRAVVLVAAGIACIAQPQAVLRLLVLVVGWLLLLTGAGELAAAVGVRRRLGASEPGEAGARSGRTWVPVTVGVVGAMLLLGLLVVQAVPGSTTVGSVGGLTSPLNACNGSMSLCTRPYDDVAFPATHNSMAAADEPSWFIPEQPTGIVGQLDAGIRAFLIDTWYGQRTDQRGRVATAQRSYADALAETAATFGPQVVRSAERLRASFTGRRGPVRPYLCHGLCEIGATAWEPVMHRVQAWLQANPREVLTFVIQDTVTPDDTVAVFREAGLLPYVYTPQRGAPWPTLGQMIASGHRVVVMMERHDGGSSAPWLMPAFQWMQDTPYKNPTLDDLTCDLNRGSSDDPLFMINNWLSGFTSLVSNARRANAYPQLKPYAERCEQERGQIPNFVAVNYYNEGSLFRVVDQLNGIR